MINVPVFSSVSHSCLKGNGQLTDDIFDSLVPVIFIPRATVRKAVNWEKLCTQHLR